MAALDACPIVEFCVVGPALSFRTKDRDRLRSWQARVAEAALVASAGTPSTGMAVEVRLTEFSEVRRKDRDNMTKPILDAMQCIVYHDDQQVADVRSDWADINGLYKVRHMSPVVATALSSGREFIWVRVLPHSPRETLTL